MALNIDWGVGFEPQIKDLSNFGAAGTGAWDGVSNPTVITFVAGRWGGTAVQIAEDGVTATNLRRELPATQHRNVGMWIKVSSAPGENSTFFTFFDSGGTGIGNLRVSTGGLIGARPGTGTFQNGPNVADGQWHHVTAHLDSSGTTWSMSWEVDEVAQTTGTQGSHVATNCTRISMGSATTTNNLTIIIDDVVASATAADFPIPSCRVVTSLPVADGTHNAGTNVIEDQSGNDIGLVAAWSLLDELPPNTTDYVRQNNAGSGNYAEIAFDDSFLGAGELITAVLSGFAGFASSGSTETGNPTTRVVHTTLGVLVDVYSGDMSEPALHYGVALVPLGSAWTLSDFQSLRLRMGFRSDSVGGDPRWSTAWMTVVVVEPDTITKTHTTTAIVSVRSTKTYTSDARISSAIVTKSHAATAILLKSVTKSHQSDAEISGGAARRGNTFEGGSNGVNITTGNSGGLSGDAFQDIAVGADSTQVYDSTLFYKGAVSAKIAAGLTLAYVGYTTLIGTQTSIYGRTYLYLDTALPTQSIAIASTLFNDGVSSVACGRIAINGAGRLRLLDQAGVQQAISPNNASGIVPVAQWVRLEWRFVGSPTTGSIEVKLFLDPTSVTPDSTTTATNIDTLGPFNRYRIGKGAPTTGTEPVFHIDSVLWDTAGYPGPAADVRLLQHTSTAIIRKSIIKTHLATAIVLKTITTAQQADARILLRPGLSHTTTAVIAGSRAATHSSDSYIYKPETRTHLSDAIIAGGFTPAPNSWIVVDVAARRASGTITPPTVTDSLGSLVTVEQVVSMGTTFLGRYYMRVGANPLPRRIFVDFLGVTMTKVHVEVSQILGVDSVDPFVRTLNSPRNDPTTSILVTMPPYTSTSNRGMIAATHSFDEVSAPEAGWNELQDLHDTGLALAVAWSDAEDDTATYSWTNAIDAIAISSEIQVQRTGNVAQSVDAVVKKAMFCSQSADASIRKSIVKTHTSDAIVGGATQKTQSADAQIFGNLLKSHTTTAVLFGRLTRTQQTDAYITETPPPPPVPTPIPGYRLALASRSTTGLGAEIIPDVFSEIGVFENFQLSWEEELNEAGRLNFALPIDHAAVTRANFAVGKREIHLHRGDTDDLVWAGTLEVAEISAWEVRFVAVGWYDKLARRTIKQDYSSRSTFTPQGGWTYLDQLAIIRELIALVQAEDSLGLTVYDPSAVTGVTRRLTICAEERRLVADVIDEFAAASNGFDFAVLPDKTFRMWFPRRDSGQPALTVDGTASFSEITYQIDASDVVTKVSGIGPAEECSAPDTQMLPTGVTPEITDYGVLDGSVDLKHNWDDEHRLAIITESLQEGDHPRFQTDITIDTSLIDAPDPLSYGIGDIILVDGSRGAAGGFGDFSLQARILKRRIIVNPVGLEKVVLTIDVEGGV